MSIINKILKKRRKRIAKKAAMDFRKQYILALVQAGHKGMAADIDFDIADAYAVESYICTGSVKE